MYIEALHDSDGNIAMCYCSDTPPVDPGSPMFFIQGGAPAGHEQARLNIDTLTAMEIEGGSGQKAVIDPETGQPEIRDIDRTEYIIRNFKVDTAREITPAPNVSMPVGMKVRGVVRR